MLERYGESSQRDPTFERRAERVLKTILVHPEYLGDIILADRKIAEILDTRLSELIALKRKKSSFTRDLYSDEYTF